MYGIFACIHHRNQPKVQRVNIPYMDPMRIWVSKKLEHLWLSRSQILLDGSSVGGVGSQQTKLVASITICSFYPPANWHIPIPRHVWRWFSFPPGGICQLVPWKVVRFQGHLRWTHIYIYIFSITLYLSTWFVAWVSDSLPRWSKKGPLSLKPLSAWYLDILERVRLGPKVWMVGVRGWMVFGRLELPHMCAIRAKKIHWSQKTRRFFQMWFDLGKAPPCFWVSGIFFPQAFFTGAMQHLGLMKKAGAELENCETFQLIDLETLQLAKYTEVKFKTSPSNLHIPSRNLQISFGTPGTLLESMAKRLICYPFARRPWITLAMHQVNWPLLRMMVTWMGDGWMMVEGQGKCLRHLNAFKKMIFIYL